MSGAFDRLRSFVTERMRMSHIYQPVMIAELLRSGGSASSHQIAKRLLDHDQSQIDYYEEIVRQMVGRVLTRNHEITSREGKQYSLIDYDQLSDGERSELIALCEAKVAEYIAKRGEEIWAHRNLALRDISGTVRYEILKRAAFRCELCGVAADERALEVDHILPRAHGGQDDEVNLQALCFRCNAMKGDRDATDFRKLREMYAHRQDGCVFCSDVDSRVVEQNALAVAIRDGYPVTDGHTLIIPRRHCETYFDLTRGELNAIHGLVAAVRQDLMRNDPTITGFNIGSNSGASAGQTVQHCHIHVIPRRDGDTPDPRGGVRGVIPAKQKY